MRFLPLLVCLISMPAFAQNAPQVQPAPTSAAPIATTPITKANDSWKSLGHPLDDDTKAMTDRYVYFDDDATDRNIGINRPVFSTAEASQWVKDHLGQILTIDSNRYDTQVITAQTLFTPLGYGDYVAYLKNAGMEKFLKDNSFKVAAYVDGLPTVTGNGVRDLSADMINNTNPKPTYTWQIEAVLVLSYLDYRNEPPVSLFPQKDKRAITNRFPVNVKLELARIPLKHNDKTGEDVFVAINGIRFSTQAQSAP